MKRAIYLSILAVITAGCILWRVGGGFGNWFHIGEKDIDVTMTTEQETSDNSSGWFGENAGKTVTVEHEALEEFTELNMDVDVLDVTVQTGEDYSISYSTREKCCPSYEVKNGKLTVTQHIKPGIKNINGPSEMTLTVPEGTVLKDVDIVSDVGNVSIDGIQTDRFTAELDVGNMNISDAALGEGSIEANVGDVCLKSVDFGNMDVDADVGDVDISAVGKRENYRIKAVADIGDVSIDGERVKKDVGAESEIQTGEGSYNLDVYADVGNVSLTFGN